MLPVESVYTFLLAFFGNTSFKYWCFKISTNHACHIYVYMYVYVYIYVYIVSLHPATPKDSMLTVFKAI